MNYLSIVFISLLALSVNAQELTFSATRRLVEPVLNNEIKPENIVEITYTPDKEIREKSWVWKVNGSSVPTKGWEFVKGYTANSKDKIQTRKNLAKQHTWSAKADRQIELIKAIIDR